MRNLAQQGMVVQPAPEPAFVVVKAQFFLELLMGLLARPAGLDGGGKLLEGGVCRMAGEVELALASGAVLAHQPVDPLRGSTLAGQVLRAGGLRPVGYVHAPGCERGTQRPLGVRAPGQRAERRVRRVSEQGRHRHARHRGHGVPGRPAIPLTLGHGCGDAEREHLLVG